MPFHFYPDYDQKAGVKLANLDEKLTYLKGRTDKILVKPLEEVFRIRGCNRAIWDLNIGVCTLICEGISGLSTYYCGSGRGDKFKNFVKDYLYPNDPKKAGYANLFWEEVRCSLSHGLYIQRASIETDHSKHFSVVEDRLILDLETLFTEFKTSCAAFFNDISNRKSSALVEMFESRFDEVFPGLV